MDKWLKRIWLVNGVVGFIAAALFIYGWVRTSTSRPPSGYFTNGPYVGENLDKAIRDSLELQDIALTLPRQVGTSPYRFIQLRVKDLAVRWRRIL